VRQVFSVHLILRLLATEKLVSSLPLLVRDNLQEVIKKCNELVKLPQFRKLVATTSRCDLVNEVLTAFLTEVENPN